MSESDEDVPECRICKCDGMETPLISPCLCKGSCEWVHEDCLVQWLRQTTTDVFEGRTKKREYECEICNTELNVKMTMVPSGVRYFTDPCSTPFVPPLIVMNISIFAPFLAYVASVALETMLLPLLQWVVPDIEPRRDAPFIVSLSLLALKILILTAAFLPPTFREFLRQNVTYPLEKSILFYAWRHPLLPTLIAFSLTLVSYNLAWPSHVSSSTHFLRVTNIRVNIFSALLLARSAFFSGTPTLTGVEGKLLEKEESSIAN